MVWAYAAYICLFTISISTENLKTRIKELQSHMDHGQEESNILRKEIDRYHHEMNMERGANVLIVIDLEYMYIVFENLLCIVC